MAMDEVGFLLLVGAAIGAWAMASWCAWLDHQLHHRRLAACNRQLAKAMISMLYFRSWKVMNEHRSVSNGQDRF